MSTNLLESLQDHLSGDVVSNLADLIGESPTNTDNAIKKVLPALLSALVEKFSGEVDAGKLFALLGDGNHNGGVLSNLGALSRGGDETGKLINDGKLLLTKLLGESASGQMNNSVAGASGIKEDAASTLIGFVLPIVLGMVGRRLKIESIENAAGLAGLLHGQNEFLGGSIAPVASKVEDAVSQPAAATAASAPEITESANIAVEETETKGDNVLTRLDQAMDAIEEKMGLDAIADKVEEKIESIEDSIEAIGNNLSDAVSAPVDTVKEIGGDIADSVEQLSAKAVSGGKEFANSAAEAFEEVGAGRKFWPWLLLGAALVLIFGLMKSCGSSSEEATKESEAKQTETPAAPPPVVTPAPANAPAAPSSTATSASPEIVEAVPVESTSAQFEKALPGGYQLKASKDGFIAKLVGFIESGDPVSKDLWFSMDGVTFDTSKASIKKESEAQLNDIAEIMKAYSKVKIKIGGYTDNTGNANDNKKLSTSRAEAVKKALIAHGVNADRVDSEGYGSEHPVASNDTEEGRQKNRRIDVKVTEK